uniref:Uncharacterized protein n=1 Tax=Anguilla anguilla TaxID=7936 RepID=A0A0E9ULY6_ANGAN
MTRAPRSAHYSTGLSITIYSTLPGRQQDNYLTNPNKRGFIITCRVFALSL